MNSQFRLEKITDIKLLKTRVYEAIKKSIVNLYFPPDQQLIEQRLAEDFGVSKSPIREALQRLEREGLVYTIPFKGCFVAKITKKDINEIFQFRKALEVFCVNQAADGFSKENWRKATELLSKGEVALREDNVERCYEANIEFHDFLIAVINNGRIIKAYSNLRDQLDRYRNLASRILGRVAKSHKEHVLIIEAIEQKDKALAGGRMFDHLESVLNDFVHSKELKSFLRE